MQVLGRELVLHLAEYICTSYLAGNKVTYLDNHHNHHPPPAGRHLSGGQHQDPPAALNES